MQRRRPAVLAAAALAAAAALTPAAAEPSAGVMIVFDGSGSMWGKLENGKDPKFQIAREGLARALPKAAATLPVGLTVFGHRRKGDCGDVEQTLPLKPRDTEGIVGIVEKLNPKGKGPLAQALREAAKVLAGRQPASLVVIHDGNDNCGQDVCAAAAEIAKAAPRLAIHTVGIALEGDDGPRTQCISKATGGKSFLAADYDGIVTAVEEAVRLAALEAAPAPAAPVRPAPPPPAAAATGAPGLALSARLPGDKQPLAVPISWRVRQTKSGNVVYEGTSPTPTVQLAPGSYAIEARIGILTGRHAAEVKDAGLTAADLVLDAGTLRLAVRNLKGAAALDGALVSILPKQKGAAPSPAADVQPVWLGRTPVADLLLPTGDYVVRVEQGLTRRETAATLASAGTADVEIVLASGSLEPVAVLGEDGETVADGVTYVISEDDPEAPGGRREIARSAAPRPLFTLPAGTYYIDVRHAGAETRQRLAVSAGDVIKRQIPLALARITVSTTLAAATKGKTAATVLRLTRLDGDATEAPRMAVSGREMTVPAGRYRLEAEAGQANARLIREIDLKPGKAQAVSMAIEAGLATLRLLDASGTAVADAYWLVRDAQGRVVLRSTEREPAILLAPGHYTVRGESRDKAGETKLIIANGETKTVETRTD